MMPYTFYSWIVAVEEIERDGGQWTESHKCMNAFHKKGKSIFKVGKQKIWPVFPLIFFFLLNGHFHRMVMKLKYDCPNLLISKLKFRHTYLEYLLGYLKCSHNVFL